MFSAGSVPNRWNKTCPAFVTSFDSPTPREEPRTIRGPNEQYLARSEIRLPCAAQESGVCTGRDHCPGARNRRQQRDLQRRQCSAATTAALHRSRTHLDDLPRPAAKKLPGYENFRRFAGKLSRLEEPEQRL